MKYVNKRRTLHNIHTTKNTTNQLFHIWLVHQILRFLIVLFSYIYLFILQFTFFISVCNQLQSLTSLFLPRFTFDFTNSTPFSKNVLLLILTKLRTRTALETLQLSLRVIAPCSISIESVLFYLKFTWL
jgi:hypothetical protein